MNGYLGMTDYFISEDTPESNRKQTSRNYKKTTNNT